METYTHFIFCPFWLRIVSIAIAVLPVWRSPMISSRCPRPIGTSASMALIPVCIAWSTDWRVITPEATRWIGYVFFVAILPAPSIGFPSTSTVRPIIASPTPISRIRPVAVTSSPSLIFEKSPSTMIPTLSSSRLSATPVTPDENVTISELLISESPETRTIPSNTSSTVPTSSTLISFLNFDISLLRLSIMLFLIVIPV